MALAGHPAVILMDIEMPGAIDGYQACRMIKDDPAVQQVPVIFMLARQDRGPFEGLRFGQGRLCIQARDPS